ncbi:MAG: hypothetical protein JWO83_4304 [Caulobacteraceae bacterium]|jgi:hypothetical protein|nr:hypothetical protein [Caulobacteraceae bacterium]
MPSYDLKLYNQVDPRAPYRKARGEFQFDAPDDLAAITRAKTRYVERLIEYDYAVLSDVRGRFVWEQGVASPANGNHG